MDHQHSVLLFVPLTEVVHQDLVGEILRSVPGVTAVFFPGTAEAAPTIEGEIRVFYNPDRTNAIVMEQALAARGFNVISAHEETAPHD